MTVVDTDSFRVKDFHRWSPLNVREFLLSILPGHPCVDLFTYTSGHVLSTLSKEELRRQTRDEEAANVIWAEIGALRPSSLALRPAEEGSRQLATCRGGAAFDAFTIFVRTGQDVALDLDVRPTDTVASLKVQIEDLEGTTVENQRLILNGCPMQDDRSLASYDLCNGAAVLLVPRLQKQEKLPRPVMFAPRGLLMVPGNKPWRPSPTGKPFLPVVCRDVARDFTLSLQFGAVADAELLAGVVREGPLALEIRPLEEAQLALMAAPHGDDDAPATTAVEARICWDESEGKVCLESLDGDALAPETEYSALAHLGGRAGQLAVTVVTGAVQGDQ